MSGDELSLEGNAQHVFSTLCGGHLPRRQNYSQASACKDSRDAICGSQNSFGTGSSSRLDG